MCIENGVCMHAEEEGIVECFFIKIVTIHQSSTDHITIATQRRDIKILNPIIKKSIYLQKRFNRKQNKNALYDHLENSYLSSYLF